MAGRYYSSTPIGAGMANLADAIGSIPAAHEKAGLMEAQRKLYEDKLLTEASQRSHYDAQTQKIRDDQAALRAAGDAARAAYLGPQSAPQPAAPPMSAPPAMPDAPPDLASAIVPGVGAVPGAAPTPPVPPPGQEIDTSPDLSSAIVPSMPAAPAVQPSMPSISSPSAGGFNSPAIQQAIAQVQKLPPQTQRELFANLVGSMTGAGAPMAGQFPDLQLAIAGGQQGTSDKPVYTAPQMSGFQEGAKVGSGQTQTGVANKLSQDLKIAEMKEAGDTSRAILHENRADGRAAAKGGGGGGKPAKPMTAAELARVNKLLFDSGGDTKPNQAQQQDMMNRFRAYRDQGMSTVDAINTVADESWQDVETPGESGWLGTPIGAKPATVTTKFAGRTRPTITPEQLDDQRATGEKPTPGAAPAAAAPKKQSKAPDVGTVKAGFRFKGGNPADKANWEKAK